MINMKQETTKLGVQAYVTPSVSVVEIHLEGVLCLSAQHEGIRSDNGDSIFDF